jgi:saccharopine dehydrogenase (NADP+, L-glutamate forming)/spermidine synthase
MRAAGILGLLDDRHRTRKGETHGDLLVRISGKPSCGEAMESLSGRFSAEEFVQAVEGFRWLGLLDDMPVPGEADSALEVLAARMQAKLQYREGERDMIVLQHRFEAEYPDAGREEIDSLLVDFGLPGGDSAMARTVGLPLAVAARLVLEKEISLTGLHIPVMREIYLPILEALTTFEIAFQEARRTL